MKPRSTPFALLPFACALAGACGGACGGAAVPSDPAALRPNVLLISIDSLRADHLSCYGYERETSPAIDRLATQGILFENAVSSSSWTLPAHAAAFTALPDSIHGVERTKSRLAESHRTLAESLRAEGYRTAGFWSGPFLDPSFGLGQGFEEYVDCRTPFELAAEEETGGRQKRINDHSHEDVTGPRLLDAVRDWFTGHEGSRPFFLFVHMWDVHYDYLPPPPYDRMFDPDYDGPVDGRNVNRSLAGLPQRDIEHALALYDGEIAWTDHHVGELLGLLDEHGLAQSTLVAVTADHGEEFFEHGRFGHRKTLFEESIRIPLIVRLPDGSGAGTRDARAVSITDIAPTILALTRCPPLPDVMGEPLLSLGGGDLPPRRAVAVSELRSDAVREQGFLLALRGSDWKLLVRRREGAPHELYDLEQDPLEQRDLLSTDEGLRARALAELERIQARLGELRARHGSAGGNVGDENAISTELEAELRSLGYIGEGESD